MLNISFHPYRTMHWVIFNIYPAPFDHKTLCGAHDINWHLESVLRLNPFGLTKQYAQQNMWGKLLKFPAHPPYKPIRSTHEQRSETGASKRTKISCGIRAGSTEVVGVVGGRRGRQGSSGSSGSLGFVRDRQGRQGSSGSSGVVRVIRVVRVVGRL